MTTEATETTGQGTTGERAEMLDGVWEMMRRGRRDEIHPVYVVMVTLAGIVLLCGYLSALVLTTWWHWLIAGLVLAFAGGVIGSAATARLGGVIQRAGNVLGIAYGISTAVIGLVASHAGVVPGGMLTGAAVPVWVTWAGVMLAGSAAHWRVWASFVRSTTPGHPAEQALKVKRARDVWTAAFQSAGLGTVTIEEATETWAGPSMLVRLDPNRTDTVDDVETRKQKIAAAAHRYLRERGEDGLGLAEATVERTTETDVVRFRVRTRDPLRETLEAPELTPETFVIHSPDTPTSIGRWDTGDEILAPISGPHRFVVGASGGGKSTLLYGFLVDDARRGYVSSWAAGTSKFGDMVEPWLQAAETVGGRPVLEMWGGGDSGSKAERRAAERVITAAYLLYRHRSASRVPEKRGRTWRGSELRPWVRLYIDEWDDVVKGQTTPIKLPNGEKMTLWEMIVDLGSKGRSLGVELTLATQRSTNEWFGGRSVNNVLANCGHRYLFRTMSASDAGDIVKRPQEKVMAQRLEELSYAMLASLAGEETPLAYGKSTYWSEADLVDVTRLANQCGVIGRLGDEAERAALHGLYVEGAQPGSFSGMDDAPTAPAASATTPATDDVEALMRAAVEGTPMPTPTEAPATTATTPDVSADESQPQDTTEDAEWAEALAAEIDALDTLSEEEVEALRQGHALDRHPRDPETLLAAIVDAWTEMDDAPTTMTAKEMVQQFGLEWLDHNGSDAGEPRTAVAASMLGSILKQPPISLTPSNTNRGRAYRLADLSARADEILGSEDA